MLLRCSTNRFTPSTITGRSNSIRMPTIVNNSLNVFGWRIRHCSGLTDSISSHIMKRHVSEATAVVFANRLCCSMLLTTVLLPEPAGPHVTIIERIGSDNVPSSILSTAIYPPTTSIGQPTQEKFSEATSLYQQRFVTRAAVAGSPAVCPPEFRRDAAAVAD